MTLPSLLRSRLLQVAAGLLLGLALVEVVFARRDDGAFPHLNVYRADADLGVRLRPHATQRFKLGSNPASDVRINALGLRGAELAAPSANEILVVGDSQAFGLGVQEHEAFAARLAQLTKRPVVNAGIPTYGPLEYNVLAKELIEQRKPKLIIYTVNMLNDLFEHARPNKDRHRVWDGWAVRTETAPRDVTWFPGRELLFRDSHAVYALRRWLHDQEARPAQTMTSEGVAADIFVASSASAQKPTEVSALLVQDANARNAQLTAHEAAEKAREARLVAHQIEQAPAPAPDALLVGTMYEARQNAHYNVDMAAAHPGDIVREPGAESSRPALATARLIREAVRERERALKVIEANAYREYEALKASRAQSAHATSLARQLEAKPYDKAPPPSVLEPRLREIRDLAALHGAEVLVVALPIDVQVSSDEWKKYGADVIDMAPTLALTDDMLASARRLGMRTLDALPALRAASPGAFLHGDIHMTKKGHDALAKAIAAAMKVPAPSPEPYPGLPEGRTYPFVQMQDWYNAEPVFAERADEAGCLLRSQDEWLGVLCEVYEDSTHPHLAARVLSGGRGEVVMYRRRSALQLRAPVLPGESFRAHIEWAKWSRELEVKRAADGAWRGSFGPAVAGEPKGTALKRHEINCVCESRYDDTCEELLPARPECRFELDGDEACDAHHRCVFGDRAFWKPCPAGQAHGEVSGRCLPLCDARRQCASGQCESWRGVDVCRSL